LFCGSWLGFWGLNIGFFSGLRVVMPIFEYKCGACGEVTEFLEKASSKAKHICKDCGGDKMDKQFSTFAPVVKEAAPPASKCQGCPNGGCPSAF
jgi:putative FmdB family regulatory protein